MTTAEILHVTVNGLMLSLVLSLPSIIVATVVGTLVSLVQALTQIQEQNIAFVFKLSAIVITMYLTARWLGVEIYQYTVMMFDAIPTAGT